MSVQNQESEADLESTLHQRVWSLFASSNDKNHRLVDRLFVWLMLIQYVVGVALALWVTPLTWVAQTAHVHAHVWIAILFGGIVTSFPIYLAHTHPGSVATRHSMAIAQAIWSALLIHLTGGRIETHFHIFGSLAFIAFYRDWKVIVTMTAVVVGDHAIRGFWWPLSVYGAATESPWRWVEHAAWVLMEDTVLLFACARGKREELEVCLRQAELEWINARFEEKVHLRTLEIEQARRDAERLALVAQHTDDSVLILDPEGKTKWVNEGFRRQTGYTLDEIEGKIPYQLLAGPSTEPSHIAAIDEGLRTGRGFDLEITKHHKNGRELVLEVEARPILDDHGDIVQFFQIERDVTRQRRDEAEQARLRRELDANAKHLAKLALVAQYTSNSVVITDANGRAEWVNEGFTRATGYELEEMVGKVPGQLLQGPGTSLETVKIIGECIHHQVPFAGEILNYTKHGESFWAYLQINPVRDQTDSLKGYIGVVTDITERKAGEREREFLQRELRDAARNAGRAEVATGVLHNVGNVLNSACVSASLLKEKLGKSTVSQLQKGVELMSQHEENLLQFFTEHERGVHFPQFVKHATRSIVKERDAELREVESLLLSIDHIREIVTAQQSAAKKRRIVEPFQMGDVIDSAIKLNQLSLSRHNVKIEKRLNELPVIESEEHEVLQVLVNLIKNAKEACDGCPSRVITISAVAESEFLRVDVSDTGIGIERENLETIFQHGFTTKTEGHGFGLHSAAISATELGGSLTAQSDGPGDGATFSLRLPLENARAECRDVAKSEGKGGELLRKNELPPF